MAREKAKSQPLKDRRVDVLFSEDELEFVKRKAKESGFKLRQLIRHATLHLTGFQTSIFFDERAKLGRKSDG